MPPRSQQPAPEASAVLVANGDSLTLHLSEVRVTLPADAIGALAAALEGRAPKKPKPDPSPYLTVAEAATYIHASRQRVYDLLCSRRLPKYKDGARVLIRRADLNTYLSR
jgi:excisionase family DNA binding protein